jgi:hypothetical protein
MSIIKAITFDGIDDSLINFRHMDATVHNNHLYLAKDVEIALLYSVNFLILHIGKTKIKEAFLLLFNLS